MPFGKSIFHITGAPTEWYRVASASYNYHDMSSPERGGPEPDQPKHEPPAEAERPPEPYRRAARFPGERPAGEAYFAAQRVIYEAPQPLDVSVYRLQLNRLWHIAAVGVVPPAPVLQAIEDILATGEPAELPPEVWQALAARRVQASKQGPWQERHYRPGRPL